MLLLNTEESILKDLDISTPKAFIIQKRLSTITEDVNRMQARRKEFYRKIGEVRKLNQYAYYRRVTGKRSRTETSPIENMKPINHSIMKNLLANTNLQRFVGKPDSYSDYRRILGKRNINSENRNVDAGIPVLAERLPRQFRIISNIAEASLSSHSLSNFEFNEFGPRLKSAKNRF